MCNLPSILASGDNFGPLIFLVVFGLWVVGAVLSGAKKKKPQQSQGQPSWQDILRDLANQGKPQPSQPPQPPLSSAPPPMRQAPPPLPPGLGQSPRPARPLPRQKLRPAVSRLQVQLKTKVRQKVRRPAPRPAPAGTASAAKRPVPEAPHIQRLPSEAEAQARAAADAGRPPRQTRPAIRAAAISKWLNPATLRQQFILTEIFQAPAAMREQ